MNTLFYNIIWPEKLPLLALLQMGEGVEQRVGGFLVSCWSSEQCFVLKKPSSHYLFVLLNVRTNKKVVEQSSIYKSFEQVEDDLVIEIWV